MNRSVHSDVDEAPREDERDVEAAFEARRPQAEGRHHVVHVPEVGARLLGHLDAVAGPSRRPPDGRVGQTQVVAHHLRVVLESSGREHDPAPRAHAKRRAVGRGCDPDDGVAQRVLDQLLGRCVQQDLDPTLAHRIRQQP